MKIDADPTISDGKGLQAIHFAAHFGQKAVIAYILAYDVIMWAVYLTIT